MSQYIVKRLGLGLLVLFIVTFFVFLIIHITPGDPVAIMLGFEANVSQEVIEGLRRQFGLDQPFHVQYARWLGRVLKGDLGRSLVTRQPVIEAIVRRLPVTLQLTITSLLVALCIGIPVGVLAAVKRNSLLDRLTSSLALSGVSTPNFLVAILLIYAFSVHARLLPASGYRPLLTDPIVSIKHIIMPSLALGTSMAAILLRMTRASLLEVLNQDFVRTARAKGLAERVVIMKHALKNALIPVTTVVGLQVGYLLSGAIIVETVFALPGIGRMLVTGLFARDVVMVQGVVLFAASAFVLVNLAVDMLYAYLDPRIKYM